MPKNPCLRSPSLAGLCLMLVALTLVPTWSWAAGSCNIFSTSSSEMPRATPQALWGELKPAGVILDATSYTGNQRADSRFAQPTSVDIENGFLFASYWAGFGIWDLRSTPDAPAKLTLVDGWNGNAFPQWLLGASETDQFIYAIDAPDGDDSIIALGGISPMSFSIWDTRNKSAPTALYQDANGKEIAAVYATTINGREYAFAGGAFTGGEFGLFVYDMTAARNYHGCLEDVTHGSRNCPGVYITKISTGGGAVQYVHGMQFGGKTFVATSPGQSSLHGMQIWDVSNPASPSRVVTGFTGNGIANFTSGVAMWQQNNAAYLAVRFQDNLQVFDVTSCLTSGCAALPSPLTVLPVASVVESNYWKTVTFSRSGGTPLLFLGNQLLCHAGQPPGHIEYLLDMSNPFQPRDITPSGTTTFKGETVDYWSYYYNDDVKGLAFSASRAGKMYAAPNGNSYFYRADLTLFDVHQWTGGSNTPPLANFTWSPSTVYTGDPITFNDTSGGLVSSRSWQFPGGSPSSSTASSQVVSYGSPGTKAVTLTASNASGPNSVTKNVTVLDPSPAVANVTFTPANPLVCQPVTFTANGVTGRSPLTTNWNVTDSTPSSVGTGTTNPFTWTTVGRSPGSYTATVTVHNGLGPDATASAVVTLGALGTMAFTGPPTNDPFVAGGVTFHAHATAATEWNWDFGDGQGYRGWTGAYAVADPTFTYSTTGQKVVKVKIRNCVTAEMESAPLSIAITQIAPLVASFQAECPFGLCGFSTGQTIAFDDHSSGSPDGYLYDWNHTGSAQGTCNPTGNGSVQTSHVYTTAGTFSPCLKVTRGVESQVYVHVPITVAVDGGGGGGGGGGQTPTITINGPTSGAPNQALSFTAAASNCTPSATWTWSPSGGSFSGSSTGSQVSISWPSNGSHTVSATNAGCGATGTISVTISDGGGGGGGGNNGSLVAAFTFSPASPNAGQTVAFDGSSSTGSPTVYSWDFGDSQTASGASVTASHTYQAGGTYTVKLEVGKQGAGCSFGVCSASITKTVTVGDGGPPPLVASFDTSAQCISDFAGVRCAADVGSAVSFTSTTANATSYSWSFGDGGTASGIVATHTWTQPGTFSVQLTVSDGRTPASTTRTFIVTGQAIVTKAVILPWIAQTRGALVQTSDLYLLNPTTAAMDVSLVFLRRGNTPETNPPKATRTIQPGATLYVADVLRQMFSLEDVAGFVTVNVDKGTVEPVITAFNTTVQSDGKAFGQTVPGLSMSTAGSAASAGSSQAQNLIGLADNSDLLASFGVSNPGKDTLSYTLRLFDKLGQQIGTPHDFVVSRFGQRQFLPREIQTLFGVSNRDDYRVEVRNNSGQIFPFSANLRAGSNDPSFVGASAAAAQKVHLIGALSSTDANKHKWQSDVVISNISTDVVLTDVSYIGTGVTAKPTAPLHLTLQPGETRRLSDVIGQQWGLRSTVGVITLDSNAPSGVFPIVQGESYDATNPTKRFGQLMTAVGEPQAAGAKASQYLVGLRQDAKNRSTLWVFNPGAAACVYDIVYRALDGHELGRIPGVAMGPGIVRQFGPTQHRLPAGGVANGFTVEVQVKSGKALAAAQVVNSASNDPAYLQGATR